MFKSSRIQSIVISAVLVAGCVDTPVSIGTPEATPDPLRAAVLSMGFRPDMIVDAGQEFVISGDISISKERLRQQLAENPAAFQKQYPQLVGTQAVQGITVDLSGLDAAWAAAARAAIDEWNAVTPGVLIHLSEGSPAQISMYFDALEYEWPCTKTIAMAEWPLAGQPGYRIRVNEHFRQDDCLSPDEKKWTMVHELGHTIGLVHTDDPCGPPACYSIPDTPSSDPYSIMNAVLSSNFAFSTYDQRAVYYLYHNTTDPQATVSYPSGVPSFSWNALAGALTYTIGFVEYHWWIDQNREFQSSVVFWYGAGPTTGTSTTWPEFPHTGFSSCQTGGGEPGDEGTERTWFIQVNYPGGSYQVSFAPAETVPCS